MDGIWRRERTENYQEIVRAFGGGFMMRKIVPKMTFMHTIQMNQFYFRLIEKAGPMYNDTTQVIGGREKTTEIVGKQFTQKCYYEDDVLVVYRRHFDEYTFTFKRYFEDPNDDSKLRLDYYFQKLNGDPVVEATAWFHRVSDHTLPPLPVTLEERRSFSTQSSSSTVGDDRDNASDPAPFFFDAADAETHVHPVEDRLSRSQSRLVLNESQNSSKRILGPIRKSLSRHRLLTKQQSSIRFLPCHASPSLNPVPMSPVNETTSWTSKPVNDDIVALDFDEKSSAEGSCRSHRTSAVSRSRRTSFFSLSMKPTIVLDLMNERDVSTYVAWHDRIEMMEILPVDIRVKGVTYTVPAKKTTREPLLASLKACCTRRRGLRIECKKSDRALTQDVKLLDNVWVTAHSGEAHAIMGGSGSGKSTLLNVILARTFKGKLDGEVTYDDVVATPGHIRTIAKFVPQEPVLKATSTAREILALACALTLPVDWTREKIDRHVNGILTRLGLDNHGDVPVGDEDAKGLSGGQKKRLSIAVELVTVPRALALDEPTSGLDSRTSLEVIKVVHSLARDDCNIMCSIHAPSAVVFQSFHRVTLIQKGKIAYSGTIPDLLKYLDASCHACPSSASLAEHALDVLTDDGDELSTMWSANAEEKANSSVPVSGEIRRASTTSRDDEYDPTYSTPPWHTFKLLFTDTVRSTIRNKRDGPLRLRGNFIVAILTALCFTGFRNSQRWVMPRRSLLFIALLYQFLNAVSPTSILVALERSWLLHEHHNARFRYTPYIVARVAAFCTCQTLYTSIYITLVFFITNLGDLHQYKLSLMVCIVHSWTSGVVGLLIGSFAKSVQHANALLAPFLIPNFLFSGFIFSRSQCPVYLLPFWYGSFFRYSMEALTYLEFNDGRFRNCGLDKMVRGKCPFGPGKVQQSIVLEALEIDETYSRGFQFNVAVITIFFIAFTIAVYFSLKRQLTHFAF